MKTKLLLSILLSFVFCLLSSQVPLGFNYQAIAREGSGSILANQALPVKIAVMDALTGGNVIYEESFPSISSNQFGLITLVVGKGTPLTGTFSAIDWKAKTLFLRTKIEYPSGTWIEMGTSPIMSVPYSLVAKEVTGPLTKLGIESSTTNMEEALFEVKNKAGNTVFAVYNEGVRAYVGNGDAKGAKGGFSVGGYDATKGAPYDLFTLNTDSARFYVDSKPHLKGARGGFSVGGYDMTKGTFQDYLNVSKDSVRVYVDSNPATKGAKGGFSVGGYDMTKGTVSDYMNIETNTTGIIDPAVNRILWYPLKNAFLTGRVLITDPANVGVNSFATGYESMAKGMYSQAMGYQASAIGNYSTAIGSYSVANNDNSFAFGNNATASNAGAYAFGTNVIASGPGSYALGVNCTASGDNSFAFGDNSQALGSYSYAIGYHNKATWGPSYAFGDKTYSKAWGATTFGWYTKADAQHAMALGSNTISNSYCELAMGEANDTTVMHYAPLPAGGSANFWLGDDPIFVIGNGDVNRSVEPPVVNSRSNAFIILKNGATGINMNRPSYMLDVRGRSRFMSDGSNSAGHFLTTTAGADRAFIGMYSDNYVGLYGNGPVGWGLVMNLDNGNVGLSTTTPSEKLEIGGSSSKIFLNSTTSNMLVFNNNGIAPPSFSTRSAGTKIVLFSALSSSSVEYAMGIDGSTFWHSIPQNINSNSFKYYAGTTEIMRITGDGRVGIGTSTPAFPLDVAIQGGSYTGSYGYLNSSGGTGTGSGTVAYSINASGRIKCVEFNAISDARAKDIIGYPEGDDNLALINRLKVTDFRYIDKIGNGNSLKQGFVAQDVEKVLPEAVHTSEGYIPDIYQLAKNFSETEDGSFMITVDKSVNLEKGDVVKLMLPNGEINRKVLRINSSHSFTTESVEGNPQSVFVYGKEVDDFRSLDYDRIFTIGIGAVQALSRENDQLKAEIQELKDEIANVKTMIRKRGRN
jgi:hypothetical protein